MKRQAASPADVLRLLKQSVGVTRLAVRAADYKNNALTLITSLKGETSAPSMPQVAYLATCRVPGSDHAA